MKIYAASSWRNALQPAIVQTLRRLGHDVYDFKQPDPSNPSERGFSWADIDPNWKQWSPDEYKAALQHPIAKRGYAFDIKALRDCDAVVFVLPCGKSASWEFGYAMGQGKKGYVVQLEPQEPELMFQEAAIITSMGELFEIFETKVPIAPAPSKSLAAELRASANALCQVGQKIRFRATHGSTGVITSLSQTRGPFADSPTYYVRYIYGKDSRGEQVTATAALQRRDFDLISEEDYEKVLNRRFNEPREEPKDPAVKETGDGRKHGMIGDSY